jgi:hypothetical protein
MLGIETIFNFVTLLWETACYYEHEANKEGDWAENC